MMSIMPAEVIIRAFFEEATDTASYPGPAVGRRCGGDVAVGADPVIYAASSLFEV